MFGSSIIAGILNFGASALNTVSSTLSFAKPIMTTVLELGTWFVKKFYTALAVIISNLIVLYAVVPLMIGSGIYAHHQAIKKCEPKVITKLRTKYKFIEKKSSEQKGDFFSKWNPMGN